jgi:HK97 gp10 family phage protein
MPRIYVDISNTKEVIEDIKRLEDRGKKKLLDAATEGAKFLKPKIQAAIPVNNENDKHLRDNIQVQKGRQRTAAVQSASVVVGKRSVDYGFHVETGTQHMEGRKFMRNTADTYAEEVSAVIVQNLLDSLGV